MIDTETDVLDRIATALERIATALEGRATPKEKQGSYREAVMERLDHLPLLDALDILKRTPVPEDLVMTIARLTNPHFVPPAVALDNEKRFPTLGAFREAIRQGDIHGLRGIGPATRDRLRQVFVGEVTV